MSSLSEADDDALEWSMTDLHPLDIPAATSALLEAKQVLDELGVVFFLEEGTCLGAIRDRGFIPWDDDVDLASVFGLHGLTEDSVEVQLRGGVLRVSWAGQGEALLEGPAVEVFTGVWPDPGADAKS